MPIRFRCAYCNQLLGIARRKAGTVVRCPGCSGQVVVPSLEEAGLAAKDKPAPGPFEANEIDKMLEGTEQPSVIQPGPGPVLASQYAKPPPPGAATVPAPPLPLPPPPAPRPPGILLSPAKATLLSVGVVVALAIAFGSGLLVGLLLALRQH
jgi:phage FluMu protein Com